MNENAKILRAVETLIDIYENDKAIDLLNYYAVNFDYPRFLKKYISKTIIKEKGYSFRASVWEEWETDTGRLCNDEWYKVIDKDLKNKRVVIAKVYDAELMHDVEELKQKMKLKVRKQKNDEIKSYNQVHG